MELLVELLEHILDPVIGPSNFFATQSALSKFQPPLILVLLQCTFERPRLRSLHLSFRLLEGSMDNKQILHDHFFIVEGLIKDLLNSSDPAFISSTLEVLRVFFEKYEESQITAVASSTFIFHEIFENVVQRNQTDSLHHWVSTRLIQYFVRGNFDILNELTKKSTEDDTPGLSRFDLVEGLISCLHSKFQIERGFRDVRAEVGVLCLLIDLLGDSIQGASRLFNPHEITNWIRIESILTHLPESDVLVRGLIALLLCSCLASTPAESNQALHDTIISVVRSLGPLKIKSWLRKLDSSSEVFRSRSSEVMSKHENLPGLALIDSHFGFRLPKIVSSIDEILLELLSNSESIAPVSALSSSLDVSLLAPSHELKEELGRLEKQLEDSEQRFVLSWNVIK